MNTLTAEKRSTDIKAKKLRREGFVTGNLFGKGLTQSIPIKIEKSAADRLLKTSNKGSRIMLNIDGQSYDALIKEIEYNPLKAQIEEMDFQALVTGEKVQSVAEVALINHDKVTTGVLEQLLNEISFRAIPTALIDKVEIDVGDMHAGDSIKMKDLEIAQNKNIDLLTDPDAIVVMVSALRNAEPEEETEDSEE